MDMIDIAIAKAFATKVAAGFSNVEVDGMTINFTLNDGQTVSLTVPTPADGVSVTDIDIDTNGDLICTMSDGTEINAGKVLPQKGVDYWTEEDKQEILDETNEKYNELLDQIPKGNKIDKAIYMDDSSNLELVNGKLLGETSQTITSISGGDEYDSPNPDYPQPISVVTGDNTVNVCGKNLFNIFNYTPSSQGVTRTVNEDGTITINGTATSKNVSFTGINILYLKAGTYIASIISSSEERVQVSIRRMIDGNVYLNIGGDTGVTEATFTISTDQYAQVRLYNDRYAANTHNFNLTFKLQLEYGETTTTFEPYQEQTQLISLGDIELCKIGNYQDRIYKTDGRWWLEKQINKKILNGSENWTIHGTGTANYYYLLGLSTALKGKSNGLCLSTHYPYKTIYTSNTEQGIATVNDNIRIRWGTEQSVKEGFKPWLANNNVTIYYVLNTPIITEITDTTLIEQLENWLKMETYKNITNIFTVTNNEQPILDITYRKDLETLFNNISQE